jgi:hypothetical protein
MMTNLASLCAASSIGRCESAVPLICCRRIARSSDPQWMCRPQG